MNSKASPKMIVLLLVMTATVASRTGAQTPSTTTIDSNSVMGFETPAAWTVRSSTSAMIMESATTTRTQGSYALQVSNPGNLVTLTSSPVSSTAIGLTGVGNAEAIFEVDVLLPTQVGNTNNTGQIQMFVNSPSRGLSKVLVGDVLFAGFRPGIYNTLKFPIPAAVGTALGGAAFSDLTFILMVSSPGTGTGAYRFDNLRVHSVQVVTADKTTQVPPGYGGSVDFVVFGGTPVAQTFTIGVIQVPEEFHLKLGTVGSSTVQLELGYDNTASFTCTYNPDATDATGKSYVLASCTGGMKAGDLVGANWAKLSIVGGDATQKLRAQLASNPMGDETGAGLLPPMPTFWGDFDSCTPTKIAAGVTPPFAAVANPTPPPAWILTPSASCSNQTAQANQIVNGFFNKVNNANPVGNWVVTPKPEFTRRFGDGSAHDNLTGPPPPGDPDFNQEGHLNPGGTFDAYWRVNGNLSTNNTASGQDTSHLEADFSGHAVLFGQDVNIASMNSTIDTSTGPGTFSDCNGNTDSSPGNVGCLHEYLFGVELPGGGTADPSVGFVFSLDENQDYDLPPIPIWVFSITIGATADIGVDASGTFTAVELKVGITPHASIGAHVAGEIGIPGVISGGLDARVDLLSVNKPPGQEAMIGADASWSIDASPMQCTATTKYSVDGTVQIGSGGGEVDLVASFGPCPFCYDASWTLFSWPDLATYTIPLFNLGDSHSFELPSPATTCAHPLNVSITPPPGGGTTVTSSPINWSFQGSATDGFTSGICQSNNATFTWSLTPSVPGDILTPNGCNANVTFASQAANTTSTRTIEFGAKYVVNDHFGTPITEQSSSPASLTVTVTPPAAGPYITSPKTSTVLFEPASSFPGEQFFCGAVVGATGTPSVTWTAIQVSSGTTTVIPAIDLSLFGCAYGADWKITPLPNDSYTIMMTARDSMGNLIGTPATVSMNFVTTF